MQERHSCDVVELGKFIFRHFVHIHVIKYVISDFSFKKNIHITFIFCRRICSREESWKSTEKSITSISDSRFFPFYESVGLFPWQKYKMYMGVEPKIGGKPQNGWWKKWNTLFFNGWFGGKTPIFGNIQIVVGKLACKFVQSSREAFWGKASSRGVHTHRISIKMKGALFCLSQTLNGTGKGT